MCIYTHTQTHSHVHPVCVSEVLLDNYFVCVPQREILELYWQMLSLSLGCNCISVFGS